MKLIAMACPVCFCASDSPMAQATNTGIIVMLVVVAAVLVGFATFFIYLIRRANAVSTAERSAALRHAQGIPSLSRDEASRYLPEEGTA
jgi:hypothetical protein